MEALGSPPTSVDVTRSTAGAMQSTTFAARTSTESHGGTSGRWRSHLTLRAEQVDCGSMWVLRLSGESDLATLAMLKEVLADAVAQNRARLVLDVSGLLFCDARSAELILEVGQTRVLSLAGATGPVERVFEILDPLETVPRYR